MSMMWRPGGDHGLVWERAVALIESTVSLQQVVTVWQQWSPGLDVSGFLERLSQATDTSLLSLPDFAVVLTGTAGVQIAVRGSFVVEIRSAATCETLTGAGVSTWIERTLESTPDGFSVRRDSVDRGGPTDADQRPISAGVVPCSQLASMSAASRVETRVADAVAIEPGVFVPTRSATPAPVAPHPGDNKVDPPDENGEASTLSEESAPDSAATLIDFEDEEGSESADEGNESADEDDGPDFGHLFGDTVLHPVEAAAVRVEPDSAEQQERNSTAGPSTAKHSQVKAEPDPAKERNTGFISGVPRGSKTAPAAAAGPLDHLLDLGDHDGLTIMQSDLEQDDDCDLGGAGAEEGTVLAAQCLEGHLNPPHRATCRVCESSVSGTPERVSRPPLGWLRTSDGESIELNAAVVAGRSPQAERVQGPVMPRLLTLPHNHISGQHLEVRLDGWNVLAVDLHSRNGTFLRRHGEKPVRLGEQAVMLVSGDVLDLGHGVLLNFEELP